MKFSCRMSIYAHTRFCTISVAYVLYTEAGGPGAESLSIFAFDVSIDMACRDGDSFLLEE